MHRIINLIDARTSDPQLKFLNLSFFGGEPLMQFKNIVKPILIFAENKCEEKGIELSVNFATNGYMLSGKIAEFIVSLKTPVSFQITLDGNRHMHDLTRFTSAGLGSYDRILDNVFKLLDNDNVSVTLRLNYTSKNIESFLDMIHDLPPNPNELKGSIRIDLQRIWQDIPDPGEDVDPVVDKIRNALVTRGYIVTGEKTIEKYRCYADRNNHIVVNYDGNIFRCTARDFTEGRSEGILLEDGTIEINERALLRDSVKWGNPSCKECIIYPICHGKCSQYKLDSKSIKGCIAGYDESMKEEILDRRVMYLVNKMNV